MCTIARVDTKNEGTSWTPNLGAMQADTTNAYIFWAGIDTTVRNSVFHNAEIWVRPVNKSTLALGTATRVDFNNVVGGEDAWDWDGVAVCRLTSGVMIAAYGTAGTAPSIHAKESAANDSTTWGARSTVDNSGANRCIGGLGTDGTNVWALTQDQNNAKLYIFKRTAANTWDSGTAIHTAATSFAASPFYDVVPSYRLSSMRCIAMQSATVGCVVLSYSSASASEDMVRCLYTTNGWTTTNEVVVKSYVGSPNSVSSGAMPKLVVGTDNRIRLMWIENNATNGFVPVLAYSDTWGSTWTVVGTPTPFLGKTWDNTYDGALVLGPGNSIYTSVFDSSDASNIKHRMYVGGDTLANWTEKVCENLAQTFSSACGSDGFVTNGQFIRVYNAIQAPNINTVNYLYEEVPPTSGGEPPLVTESLSGTDQPNMYLRLDIADDRGWSAHQTGVTCFVAWPEGDYTTERRKPEILGAVSSMDANIQDVAILPAYWKMDDPERWGKEALVKNEDATYTYIDDPFLFVWRSTDLNFGESGSQNVIRAVYLKYRRPSQETFDVQVWIDGVIADVQTIPAGLGPQDEPAEFWWPIPRSTNVGSRVQLRIEDRERIDLKVEEFSIKFRPKHWRMRG